MYKITYQFNPIQGKYIMARYRKPKRRRTPIKSTKTYRNGMIQVLLITIVGLSIGMRTKPVQDLVAMINNVVPGGQA